MTTGEALDRIRVPCHKSGVGYGIECTRGPCKKDNEESTSVYEGESSRNSSVRLLQHYDLYKRDTDVAKKDSWMWEHTMSVHDGLRGDHNGLLDYKPVVYGAFIEALLRIIDEGVRIKDKLDDPRVMCLNSKNEYFKPQYSRMMYSGLILD